MKTDFGPEEFTDERVIPVNRQEMKTRYLLENKALQAIEALCMMLGDGVDVETVTHKEFKKFANEVYQISHAAQHGSCFDVHDDWRAEIDEILRAADKHGIARYRNPLEEKHGSKC